MSVTFTTAAFPPDAFGGEGALASLKDAFPSSPAASGAVATSSPVDLLDMVLGSAVANSWWPSGGILMRRRSKRRAAQGFL